jgi:L-amino acid N-acyltransferase YncA
MIIRKAEERDFDQIWHIFHEIVSAGETYAYPQNSSKEEAKKFWIETPRETFVAVDGDEVIGTYYLKSNQVGLGSHVSNCGYMVSSKARGKGVATEMCKHSQTRASELGYRAMQFNFVASSNKNAIKLWKKLGFEIVGKVPRAFNHSKLGFIDALIMYKWF